MAVYLFFDESGNLDFSRNGTRYYVFGALTTHEPAAFSRLLSEFRYELLSEGVELEFFHATEDRQHVRDRVFRIIDSIGGFEFDAVIIDKAKVAPPLREETRFYPRFASELLTRVFERHPHPGERIVIVTDRLPVNRKRQAVEKAFKTFLRQKLQDRPFSIVHHSSAGHSGLQAADYCTWAIFKKWTTGEARPYEQVRRFVRSETEVAGAETDEVS
jgi:hypothetical protein